MDDSKGDATAEPRDQSQPLADFLNGVWSRFWSLSGRTVTSGVLPAYAFVYAGWMVLFIPLLFAGIFLGPAGAELVGEESQSAQLFALLVPTLSPSLIIAVGVAAIACLFSTLRSLVDDVVVEAAIGDAFADVPRHFVGTFVPVAFIALLMFGLPQLASFALPETSHMFVEGRLTPPMMVAALGWVTAIGGALFYFGPAPYLAATRRIGAFDSFGAAFRYVRARRGKMFVAWILFALPGIILAGGLGLLFFGGCASLLVVGAVDGVGLFVALLYWTSVYATLEEGE